jgi:hypothetical protein
MRRFERKARALHAGERALGGGERLQHPLLDRFTRHQRGALDAEAHDRELQVARRTLRSTESLPPQQGGEDDAMTQARARRL